jgi:UDP-N-acetylglucosamine 2-epimerase (non-hydrolysing)
VHIAGNNVSVLRVFIVMGTRPEAIKLSPVAQHLSADERFDVVVATTGQHHEMLTQVTDTFEVSFDVNLDLFVHGQTIPALTSRAVDRASVAIREANPDVVIVQGDTTSAFAAALAAFYEDTPVAHVEAGLRTGDPRSPYPEEMNRRLITQLGDLHLAPTETNRSNLLREGVAADAIVVTGNTVIDALLWATRLDPDDAPELRDALSDGPPTILVTAHRRESWGAPMRSISAALAEIAAANPEWLITFPIHRNPLVRADIAPAIADFDNVVLIEPLDYLTFAQLMKRSTIVLTDSGGIQEEAPSLGKPVLVMRDKTERPEAVTAGTVRLVGTQTEDVVAAVQRLISDQAAYDAMARAVNPYGDGQACPRIAEALRWRYTGSERPSEFVP